MKVIINVDDHGNDISKMPYIFEGVSSILIDKTKIGNDYILKLIDSEDELIRVVLASRVDSIIE